MLHRRLGGLHRGGLYIHGISAAVIPVFGIGAGHGNLLVTILCLLIIGVFSRYGVLQKGVHGHAFQKHRRVFPRLYHPYVIQYIISCLRRLLIHQEPLSPGILHLVCIGQIQAYAGILSHSGPEHHNGFFIKCRNCRILALSLVCYKVRGQRFPLKGRDRCLIAILIQDVNIFPPDPALVDLHPGNGGHTALQAAVLCFQVVGYPYLLLCGYTWLPVIRLAEMLLKAGFVPGNPVFIAGPYYLGPRRPGSSHRCSRQNCQAQ